MEELQGIFIMLSTLAFEPIGMVLREIAEDTLELEFTRGTVGAARALCNSKKGTDAREGDGIVIYGAYESRGAVERAERSVTQSQTCREVIRDMRSHFHKSADSHLSHVVPSASVTRFLDCIEQLGAAEQRRLSETSSMSTGTCGGQGSVRLRGSSMNDTDMKHSVSPRADALRQRNIAHVREIIGNTRTLHSAKMGDFAAQIAATESIHEAVVATTNNSMNTILHGTEMSLSAAREFHDTKSTDLQAKTRATRVNLSLLQAQHSRTEELSRNSIIAAAASLAADELEFWGVITTNKNAAVAVQVELAFILERVRAFELYFSKVSIRV